MAGMIIDIPVTKAGVTYMVKFDPDKPSPAAFAYLVALGTKQVLARGMTKLTKDTPDVAELVAEAVEKNLQAIYEGKIRMTGGVKQKTAGKGEVHTEAMRVARIAVKDAIKEKGGKPSIYAASTISELAEKLLAKHPELVEEAKHRIEARKQEPKVDAKDLIDLDTIAVSAAKATAAEKKAKERKAAAGDQLSAKQAGKTKGKGKAKVAPAKGQAPTHHASA
jgi:hypothetical protein